MSAAGRPLRFYEKYIFPKDQKRYHEVNRERATGNSMASRWTAGSWVGDDSWEAGMIAPVVYKKHGYLKLYVSADHM